MSPFDHDHWQPGRPCPAIGCYQRFNLHQFSEVWGLGQYTIADEFTGNWKPSFFGQRIHDAKYVFTASAPDLAVELGTYVAKFARAMLPGPFDVVIAPPPNRPTGASIVPMIADVVAKQGIGARSGILGKTGPVPVAKTLAPEERSLALSGKYVCGSDIRQLQVTRALIIDDVFESGATLTEAGRALKQVFPEAAVFGIAVTYLRSPDEGKQ